MIRVWIAARIVDLVAATYGVAIPSPAIDMPKNPEYGDFATNVAFGLAQQLRKSPMAIAQELCDTSKMVAGVEGIEFVPLNGFVNLKLNDALIWRQLQSWNPTTVLPVAVPQRILLEYVSANPTGPLHIGHGRWAVIGSCLKDLLVQVGHQVHSEFYVNDAGNQIGLFRASVAAIRDGEPVPEGGYLGAYVKDLVDAPNPVEAMRSAHESTLARIGVVFDQWFSEQTLHDRGAVAEAISVLRDAETVYQADAAEWFRSTDFGDDKDRVLTKSDGSYTYFAVDCAYHADKMARAGDRMINIWGADHHGYVPRVRAMVQALGGAEWASASRFKVIIGQLVTLLKNGEPIRMSKRTGEMVTLDESVDEIGSDATRFFLAMKSSDSSIEFDLEVAKKKSNENPVFYVQYAHARICAIYRKLEILAPADATHEILNTAERNLMMWCLQFQDEIHAAAENLAPNRVVFFLIELARLVHGMYESSPILKTEPALQRQRLYILEKARACIEAGLQLLRISAPIAM